MNCGIPYCHGTGAVDAGHAGLPGQQQIPDFNDLVYQGNWERLRATCHSTNIFRNSPAASARRRAGLLHASTSTTTRFTHQNHSECAIVDRRLGQLAG